MLKKIALRPRRFGEYSMVLEQNLLNKIHQLVSELRGKRVLYINSAPNRGGVAMILASMVPLMRDLGIDAKWYSLQDVPVNFYKATKIVHNALQGNPRSLTDRQWKIYEDYNRRLARQVDASNWDYIMIQDHQVAAILPFMDSRGSATWIWRSHVDSADPNPELMQRFRQYLQAYDGAMFTLKDYVFKDFKPRNLMVSPVAIDGLSAKNRPMSLDEARARVEHFGININRPFISQVSRFDPWKDLPGVVEAWRLARRELPGLQLAIIAPLSKNDTQAKAIHDHIIKMTRHLKSVHVIVNRASQRDIKAFQTASDVVVHKSTREGFGLAVSEALWSKRPVVGGNVGGIRLQIIPGKDGYLVDSIEDCAKRIVHLVSKPSRARIMGEAGHEHVRKHFLMPRLLKDEIEFMLKVSGYTRTKSFNSPAKSAGLVKR